MQKLWVRTCFRTHSSCWQNAVLSGYVVSLLAVCQGATFCSQKPPTFFLKGPCLSSRPAMARETLMLQTSQTFPSATSQGKLIGFIVPHDQIKPTQIIFILKLLVSSLDYHWSNTEGQALWRQFQNPAHYIQGSLFFIKLRLNPSILKRKNRVMGYYSLDHIGTEAGKAQYCIKTGK